MILIMALWLAGTIALIVISTSYHKTIVKPLPAHQNIRQANATSYNVTQNSDELNDFEIKQASQSNPAHPQIKNIRINAGQHKAWHSADEQVGHASLNVGRLKPTQDLGHIYISVWSGNLAVSSDAVPSMREYLDVQAVPHRHSKKELH